MQTRNLVRVGVLTWALVGAQHVVWGLRNAFFVTAAGVAWAVCYAAFAVAFWLATREGCTGLRGLLLIAVQALLALFCISAGPPGFLPVLLVVVAGQLGDLRAVPAVAWISVQSAILGALYAGRARESLQMTIAYFTFQLFGAFTARIAHEESAAKQALAAANAELRVATGLLDISSRTEERLRIARDLHDLIGHHLTALSLNLEVASHLASGPARDQIEKSQSLTKLLLSDVRDVVGRLRDEEPVDLEAALRSVREAIRTPEIRIDTGPVRVSEIALAQTVLRCVQEIVTNAVRHSGARHLSIRMASADGALMLIAKDDGAGTDEVRFGSGLRGMRERIQHAGGTLEVASQRGHGFEIRIRLPHGASMAAEAEPAVVTA